MCTGTVDVHGKCRACGEFTPGVFCYSTSMVVKDIKHPEEFNALSPPEAGDKMEFMEVPVVAGCLVKHDSDKQETFKLAFDCALLPPPTNT